MTTRPRRIPSRDRNFTIPAPGAPVQGELDLTTAEGRAALAAMRGSGTTRKPRIAPQNGAQRATGQRGYGPRFARAIVAGWQFATRQTAAGQRGYAWHQVSGRYEETPLFPIGDGAAVSPDAAAGEHYCHVITWLEERRLV